MKPAFTRLVGKHVFKFVHPLDPKTPVRRIIFILLLNLKMMRCTRSSENISNVVVVKGTDFEEKKTYLTNYYIKYYFILFLNFEMKLIKCGSNTQYKG